MDIKATEVCNALFLYKSPLKKIYPIGISNVLALIQGNIYKISKMQK